jgi:hypothetical protein
MPLCFFLEPDKKSYTDFQIQQEFHIYSWVPQHMLDLQKATIQGQQDDLFSYDFLQKFRFMMESIMGMKIFNLP